MPTLENTRVSYHGRYKSLRDQQLQGGAVYGPNQTQETASLQDVLFAKTINQTVFKQQQPRSSVHAKGGAGGEDH